MRVLGRGNLGGTALASNTYGMRDASSIANVPTGAIVLRSDVNSTRSARGTTPGCADVPIIVYVLPEFVTPSVKISPLRRMPSMSRSAVDVVVAYTSSCVVCSAVRREWQPFRQRKSF